MARLRSDCITAVLAIVLLFAAAAVSRAIRERKPHDFNNKCYDCHLGPKDPTMLKKDADILCLACHPEQKVMSHPTGMRPSRPLPSRFPLYKGTVKCITCHIAHKTMDDADLKNIVYDGNPYLLRYDTTGKAFCFQCHGLGDAFQVETRDMHALGMGKAHVVKHDVSLDSILGEETRACLSCHDGTLSRDAVADIQGIEWEHGKSIGVSHPIGIEYRRSYRKAPGKYNPESSLDQRIRLVNGKIGCETCHDHYSKYPKMLVMDNTRSRLCLACHNL